MESEFSKRPAHREWRRLVKKERRKRLRQKAARERDEEADRLKKTLLQSSDYWLWLQDQNKQQEEEEKRAQEEHAQLEKAWLEAEVSNGSLIYLRLHHVFSPSRRTRSSFCSSVHYRGCRKRHRRTGWYSRSVKPRQGRYN